MIQMNKDAKKFPNLRDINGWYYIDFVDPSGRRIQKSLKTRSIRIAEQRVMKIRTEAYQKGHFEIKRPIKMLFSELANKVLEYVKDRKKSYSKYYVPYMRNLSRFFENKYLQEITSPLITQYQSMRKKEVKPATVNRELQILKRCFNLAIQWELTNNNPVRGVEFFKEPRGRIRFLTVEEIDRLIECCSGELKYIVTLAIYTGMRKGEIFNLKWRNINLANRLIILEYTKNGETREIPMSDNVYHILSRKYIEKYRESEEYVFPSKNGNAYTNVDKSFKTALNLANIKDFRFHDLRHSFASQLVMSGVDILTIKELMGHKDISTTLIYSHLAPQHKIDAIAKFSNYLFSQKEAGLCEKNVKNTPKKVLTNTTCSGKLYRPIPKIVEF